VHRLRSFCLSDAYQLPRTAAVGFTETEQPHLRWKSNALRAREMSWSPCAQPQFPYCIQGSHTCLSHTFRFVQSECYSHIHCPESNSLSLSLKDFFLSIWVHCSYLQTHQKRAWDPITDGCEPPCGCWELNSEPLGKQPVLLTAEPSLQPRVQLLLTRMLNQPLSDYGRPVAFFPAPARSRSIWIGMWWEVERPQHSLKDHTVEV
jgi:hypothetical protein